MPWYSSQTIEIIYWKWETKILNSFVGRSCLLHITLVLELHICKSLRYSSFLGGWSHTQRKFVNFPCTGKTLCLTCGPPSLIGEPSGRHRTSSIALFPTKYNLRILLHTFWNLFAISSQPFYSAVCCIYKMPDSELRCRLIWATPPEQTHTGRHPLSCLVFSPNIWKRVSTDNRRT